MGVDGVQHGLERLLGLAHEEGVEERCQGSRVGRARAAGDDDRIGGGAVGSAQRNPGQVEHLEHVRVGQLGLQRDAEEVEVANRPPRFEGEEGDRLPAHRLAHVGPGAVDALGSHRRPPVHLVVEDLQRLVRYAHLVGVRIAEADDRRRLRLSNLVRLASDISRWAADRLQDGLDPPLHHRIGHQSMVAEGPRRGTKGPGPLVPRGRFVTKLARPAPVPWAPQAVRSKHAKTAPRADPWLRLSRHLPRHPEERHRHG